MPEVKRLISGALAGGSFVAMVTALGAAYTLDDRWNQEPDTLTNHKNIIVVAQRVENFIANDNEANLRQQMWEYRNAYGSYENMPADIQREYDEIKVQHEVVKGVISDIAAENAKTLGGIKDGE